MKLINHRPRGGTWLDRLNPWKGAGTALAVLLVATNSAQAAPPPNDNLTNAVVITGTLPLTVHGTNLNATLESGEPNHSDYINEPSNRSIWYSWTPDFTGTVTFTTEGSGSFAANDPLVDTQVGVYTGDSIATLALVAKKDDSDEHFAYGWTRLVVNVTNAVTYKIAVAGWKDSAGRIQLNLYPGVYTPPKPGQPLTVNIFPADAGTVTLDPPQPQEGYQPGTVVTLSAAATGTNFFSAWGGAASGSSSNVTVTVNGPLTVRAMFNADHRLFFQHTGGRVVAWLFQSTNFLGGSVLRNGTPIASGWRIVGNGDFDVNGSTDIVFQHTDGRVAMWLLDGLNFVSSKLVRKAPTGCRVRAISDLNGDNSPEIVLQHKDGRVQAWSMNTTNFSSQRLIRRAATGWRVFGAADLDANTKPDLILQHTGGRIAGWLMDGTNVVSSSVILDGKVPAAAWRLSGVADLNNNGSADLLWQHSDGRIATWFLSNTNFVNALVLRDNRPIATGWKLLSAQ